MIKKKTKLLSKIGIIAIATLSILGSISTIWAFNPPQDNNWNPTVELGPGEFEEFAPFSAKETFCIPKYIDFSESNTVFESEDGLQVPVRTVSEISRVSCKHKFTSGMINYHTLNSSGGCSVTQYKVVKCTKCSYAKSKTYYNTINYSKCIHR